MTQDFLAFLFVGKGDSLSREQIRYESKNKGEDSTMVRSKIPCRLPRASPVPTL